MKNNRFTVVDFEARMVLKSLERQSMTLTALERHWSPTWSRSELEHIVGQLCQQKLVTRQRSTVLERGHFVDQFKSL